MQPVVLIAVKPDAVKVKPVQWNQMKFNSIDEKKIINVMLIKVYNCFHMLWHVKGIMKLLFSHS